MKKHFLAILAVLLLASCTNSDVDPNDITAKFDGTQNIHESLERHKDGSITYHALPWSGLVASVRERNLPVDWSGYESISIEFAQPLKVGTQLKVGRNIRTFGRVGITTMRCYFDGQDVSQIGEVVLQTADSCDLTVKRVYLTPGTSVWDSTPIWTGECAFGNWERGFNIAPEHFLDAQEGDQLEFIYTIDTSDPKIEYWQFKTIYDGTDRTLEGNADQLNDWGCASVGDAGIFRIHLTAKDVKELRKIGMFTNGFWCVVTQVNLLKRGYVGETGSGS